MLLSDDIRDTVVIPVSVTGALRKGKSSLLNALLRYLRAGAGDGAWLDAGDASLRGFPCGGGRHPVTRGVDLWSRPLPVTLASGQPAVLLLLDAQGAFGAASTQRESVMVRALVGLLSAVQVVHVSRQLQADDLAQLRLCAEYGRLMRLVMLVRDWAFPDDAPYGPDGGRQVLEHWLQDDCGDGPGLAAAVQGLECFLLPHPGSATAGAARLEPEFRCQLRRLTSERLVVALDEQLQRSRQLNQQQRALSRALAGPSPELSGWLSEQLGRRLEEARQQQELQRAQEAAQHGTARRLERIAGGCWEQVGVGALAGLP
ncbi:atlastin-3-like [Pollicipes pollicipes]|uniref:atlastin-3-like n=1 Tax=Pollicipes pollicipes TaxID=41117 RepID=UPI001884B5D8|nr:atlastin-3-like [Pollicipes pollicipes]